MYISMYIFLFYVCMYPGDDTLEEKARQQSDNEDKSEGTSYEHSCVCVCVSRVIFNLLFPHLNRRTQLAKLLDGVVLKTAPRLHYKYTK